MTDTLTVPDCLLCAVRELTEGRPNLWVPTEQGEEVSGVVTATGEQPGAFNAHTPYVDLWLGGNNRVRVLGLASHLRGGLERAQARIGDRLTATFDGTRQVYNRPVKAFTVTVTRGHH